MKTIELSNQEFIDKVANYKANPNEWIYLGDKPAIIDFYASWCGPCKTLSPILDTLAEEYSEQINIYKINVDSEEELATVFGVKSIPTLLFIPMDSNPQKHVGLMSKAQLEKVISDLLKE